MKKHYHISYANKEVKEKNIKLYNDIESNGQFIKSEWNGDYFVKTYNYNNKIYELWDNMEYNIMSEIVEVEV